MERQVRARVLLAEAEALGLTIEDAVAAFANTPVPLHTYQQSPSTSRRRLPPFASGTAATYRSCWRLEISSLSDRHIDRVGVDDCEAIVADAVTRAQERRP
jgi:hypothetical protein